MNGGLIRRLIEAQGQFVPRDRLGPYGPELERDLRELAAFGFALEFDADLGVRCVASADRLCPDQIEHEIGTRRVGRQIAVWRRVSSTNDLAERASKSEANDGLVILAEEQTAGRGSRGRAWLAPPCSCVLLSVLLFPRGLLSEPGWMTALAAVAVAETVAAHTRQVATIKWPNDVRVGGRKVSGILVERKQATVVGVGLNANLLPEQFPSEIRESATSIQQLAGTRVDRSELARDLIRRLDGWHCQCAEQGTESLAEAWRGLSEHEGRLVRVASSLGECQGIFRGITAEGQLRIEGPAGRWTALSMGEVRRVSELEAKAVNEP